MEGSQSREVTAVWQSCCSSDQNCLGRCSSMSPSGAEGREGEVRLAGSRCPGSGAHRRAARAAEGPRAGTACTPPGPEGIQQHTHRSALRSSFFVRHVPSPSLRAQRTAWPESSASRSPPTTPAEQPACPAPPSNTTEHVTTPGNL